MALPQMGAPLDAAMELAKSNSSSRFEKHASQGVTFQAPTTDRWMTRTKVAVAKTGLFAQNQSVLSLTVFRSR
jgi:hypothetical protein